MITSKDWPLRERFMAQLRSSLAALSQRAAWYPGSEAKVAAFKERFPKVCWTALVARRRKHASQAAIETRANPTRNIHLPTG